MRPRIIELGSIIYRNLILRFDEISTSDFEECLTSVWTDLRRGQFQMAKTDTRLDLRPTHDDPRDWGGQAKFNCSATT